VIDLTGVRKEYGDVVAVADLDLTVEGSGLHCLVGPNGSGKTTLFRLLLGLVRPTAGSVSVSGTVGAGFQRPNVYPDLTVRENLAVFAGMVGAPGGGWPDRVVEELGLKRALDRPAGDLSGGDTRKLDLALALLKRPDHLLLDEPLAALDDVSKTRLLDFLDAYSEEAAVLVSTHRVEAVGPYADRLTVLDEGDLLFDRRTPDLDLDGRSLATFYADLLADRAGVGGDG